MYVTATFNLDSTELKEGFIERDDADYSEQYNTGDYGIMGAGIGLEFGLYFDDVTNVWAVWHWADDSDNDFVER